MASPSAAPSPEKQKVYEAVVDVLFKAFHTPVGFRPVHAKGIICEGLFTPSAGAASLSRAAHFQSAVPVYVRLSDFTGIPNIPDTDPNANPRGLALKFRLPGGAETDIVAHSVNGFPAATAEELLEFLQAVVTSGPDTPHPTPVENFLGTHPAALAFVSATKLPPVSFSTEAFYAVNAFRFVNKNGIAVYARYQVQPVDGEKHLTEAETAQQTPDFLFDELRQRLANKPFELKLLAQLAGEGDDVNNGSVTWPDNRPRVELGTIKVLKPLEDSDAAQRRMIFDPVRVTDGIELSDDPLPPARSAVYSISYARRNP
jgi:catalase